VALTASHSLNPMAKVQGCTDGGLSSQCRTFQHLADVHRLQFVPVRFMCYVDVSHN
jgi:hypothetical protein